MNSLEINSIKINNNQIIYDYKIIGEWNKYFNENEKLYIEYNENIEGTPYGVAVIPFLCNILPIAWIFDAQISLDEIDRDFYLSIPKFKEGYINMYPKIQFLGKIKPNIVVDYKKEYSDKSLCLFSGGVDAFNTFLSHINERPSIATVWGADVKLSDEQGWNKVLSHAKNTSCLYNVESKFIKSNFRTFINEYELTISIFKKAKDGWWHGFQHGIGMIGLIAPITYKDNISKVYIAASFTINEKGKVTCASDPTIDNNVKFCGCGVEHDGYDVSRQQKIKFICEYAIENSINIPLRVCWESKGGSNCCRCEKCYRTLFGIIAEKQDPRQFGFYYSDEELKIMIKDLKNKVYIGNFRWKYIQDVFRKNYTVEQVDKNLLWFYKVDISRVDKRMQKIMRRLLSKFINKIKYNNI
ncbi:hypothetical protein [Romboutsia lituseburensis]|uniref:hypothetical protein n=1 Tax=Romboutsia lituseburensis TaxID=1537 RepID=UPI00215B72DD|nr:hypothetical protein [Romboutsia lituseburensis]MCR8746799.1 hypothetical protein [Romboutsia lituseburensis]